MSRSYKKTPGFTDHRQSGTKKEFKRFANKKVRRVDPEILLNDGAAYKKIYNQYDICDWKFLFFTEEELQRWEKWVGPRHQAFMK